MPQQGCVISRSGVGGVWAQGVFGCIVWNSNSRSFLLRDMCLCLTPELSCYCGSPLVCHYLLKSSSSSSFSDALKGRLVASASTGVPLLVRVPRQDCLPGHELLAVCWSTAHSSDGHSQGTGAEVCSISHLQKRRVLQTEASQSGALCWAEWVLAMCSLLGWIKSYILCANRDCLGYK